MFLKDIELTLDVEDKIYAYFIHVCVQKEVYHVVQIYKSNRISNLFFSKQE